ncbi:hypothetical protein [Sandarakinorhabdus sp. DWP1-3-1]|uniref:hypothetical protein n=1 Tax=Sandarakinorhabdus sp. DWP1-3-1 TaxID=2804627 RepID=UPI003CED4B2C
MPTPISPTANMGPPTRANGAGAGASTSISMARPGATTPASAIVGQARDGQARG